MIRIKMSNEYCIYIFLPYTHRSQLFIHCHARRYEWAIQCRKVRRQNTSDSFGIIDPIRTDIPAPPCIHKKKTRRRTADPHVSLCTRNSVCVFSQQLKSFCHKQEAQCDYQHRADSRDVLVILLRNEFPEHSESDHEHARPQSECEHRSSPGSP